jgi:hypothetical protein
MAAIQSKFDPHSGEFQSNARAASLNAPIEETRFGVFRMQGKS